MKRALVLGSALFAAVFLSAAQAKQFEVLHSFDGSDGAYPNGNLQLDRAGNLYGTTDTGGDFDKGTIFRIGADGTFSVMHSFTDGADGGYPNTGLAIDAAAGDLYGTTLSGGKSLCGSIFRLTGAGDFTVLHDFSCNKEGDGPNATLTRDKHGNLYGSVSFDGPARNGSIFELTANGKFHILHAFRATEGAEPLGQLLQKGSDLYGVASIGGSGSGTIFRITTDGAFETLCIPNKGVGFSGGMARDDAGNLYGPAGWAPNGSIYALSPEGTLSTLYAFTGPDGRFPVGDILLSKRGYLYGAAARGGNGDHGTLFRLDLTGNFKTMHVFAGDDGSSPNGGLIQGKDGMLYGTTQDGGSHDKGVVFRVKAR